MEHLTEEQRQKLAAEAIKNAFDKYGKTDPETGNRVLTIGGEAPPLTPEETREAYARMGFYY